MPHGLSIAAQYQQQRYSLIKEQRRKTFNELHQKNVNTKQQQAMDSNQHDQQQRKTQLQIQQVEHKTPIKYVGDKRIVAQHHAVHIESTTTSVACSKQQHTQQTIEVIMKSKSTTPNTAKSTMISLNSDTSKTYALRRVLATNNQDKANDGYEDYSYYSYEESGDSISSSSSSSIVIPLVRPIPIRPKISFPIVVNATTNGFTNNNQALSTRSSPSSSLSDEEGNQEKNEKTLQNIMKSLFENELKCNTPTNMFQCGTNNDDDNDDLISKKIINQVNYSNTNNNIPHPIDEITIIQKALPNKQNQKQSFERTSFSPYIKQCCFCHQFPPRASTTVRKNKNNKESIRNNNISPQSSLQSLEQEQHQLSHDQYKHKYGKSLLSTSPISHSSNGNKYSSNGNKYNTCDNTNDNMQDLSLRAILNGQNNNDSNHIENNNVVTASKNRSSSNNKNKPNTATTRINNDIVFYNDDEIEITTTLPSIHPTSINKVDEENNEYMTCHDKNKPIDASYSSSSSSSSSCYISDVHSPLPTSPPLSQPNSPYCKVHKQKYNNNTFSQNTSSNCTCKQQHQNLNMHGSSLMSRKTTTSSKIEYRKESAWKPFEKQSNYNNETAKLNCSMTTSNLSLLTYGNHNQPYHNTFHEHQPPLGPLSSPVTSTAPYANSDVATKSCYDIDTQQLNLIQRSSSSSTKSSTYSNNCLLPLFVSPAYKFRHIAHSMEDDDDDDDDDDDENHATDTCHSDTNQSDTNNCQLEDIPITKVVALESTCSDEINHSKHNEHQTSILNELRKNIATQQQMQYNRSNKVSKQKEYNPRRRSSSASTSSSPILMSCQDFNLCNFPSLISKCFCDWSSGL